MTVLCSVTFEFDRLPPVTHRCTVTGGSAATCLHRAVREAQQALKPREWSSIVAAVLCRAVASKKGHPSEND